MLATTGRRVTSDGDGDPVGDGDELSHKGTLLVNMSDAMLVVEVRAGSSLASEASGGQRENSGEMHFALLRVKISQC